jgi:hypothetical protein
MVQAARLVTTINRLMGEKRPDTATALAAVEQATAADRTDLLKRLTKEMLLEPTRRIELDDLISQEVRRVLAVLKDEDRVAGPLIGTNEEKIVRIAEEAQSIWNLVAPFCASLHVAGRWGAPELLTPWATGIRSFVAASNVVTAGIEPFLKLRQLPGMVSIMTAALSCVASGNWLNLKTLVVDQYVRDRYEQKPLAILETTDPYRPFGDTDWVANTLARATTTSRDLDDSLKDFTERRQRKYAAPVAEWLHNVLRPIVADQLPDADSYSPEFDQAEIVLGVLAQDMANVRARDNSDGRSWVRSRWFARSVSQAGRGYRNPVADLVHEFDTQGVQWGPLRSGLFGGDEARARDALDKFQAEFDRIVTRRAFD